MAINNDMIEGQWKEIRGKVQKAWGDLTNDDLDQVNGSRLELEGQLQRRYGYSKERAKQEVSSFIDRL
jgi:uncharacterized protein YjbJ (UPF0337 family)